MGERELADRFQPVGRLGKSFKYDEALKAEALRVARERSSTRAAALALNCFTNGERPLINSLERGGSSQNMPARGHQPTTETRTSNFKKAVSSTPPDELLVIY